MRSLFIFLLIFSLASLTFFLLNYNSTKAQNLPTGNVIFIHPDGTSLASWNAIRILYYGPDGRLNWDKLTNIGLYQGYTKNTLTASSQAGATIHAYGVNVEYDAYGMDGKKSWISLSGYNKKAV